MEKFYRVLNSEKNWRLWRCHWKALKGSGPKVGDKWQTQRYRQLVWRARDKMMWKRSFDSEKKERESKQERERAREKQGPESGEERKTWLGWQMTTNKSSSLLWWVGIFLNVLVDVSITLFFPFLSELEDEGLDRKVKQRLEKIFLKQVQTTVHLSLKHTHYA